MNKKEIDEIKKWLIDFKIANYKDNEDAIKEFEQKKSKIYKLRYEEKIAGIVPYKKISSWTKDLDEILKSFDKIKKM